MGVKYQHRCPLVDTELTATRIEVSQYKDTIYLNRFVLSSIYQALHNTRRDASATTRSSHQLQLALNSSVLHAMLQYRRSKQHNSKWHVPLLQIHMEEDSRVWPSKKLQRPTRCQ